MTSPKKLESHTHKMKPLGNSKGSSNTIPQPQRLFPRTLGTSRLPEREILRRDHWTL